MRIPRPPGTCATCARAARGDPGSGRVTSPDVTDIRSRPERLPVGMLLAGVGGFLDAYTFVGYKGVFANAQTGNIVLLGVDAQASNWRDALLHVPPIVTFMLGVALAHALAQPTVREVVRRPTRLVLGAEIIVLAVVGSVPGHIPVGIVPGAISFVSAVQVSTFRSLNGVKYTSTISTGNLRDLTASLVKWRVSHDSAAGHDATILGCIVTSFAVGAAVGGLCTRLIGHPAAWVPAAVLIAVLITLVNETWRLERENAEPCPDPSGEP
jgi:uncharacterized membrane protein YoaK (UPF0700 family)